MTQQVFGERTLLAVGFVPLVAAAAWLVALREPTPVMAHASANWPSRSPGGASERTLAPEQARLLGVIVAGQEAELGAELTGQVAHAFAQLGQRVRRGEPLIQLDALSVSGAAGIARATGDEQRASERAALLALEIAQDKAQRMDLAPNAYSELELRAVRLDAQRARMEVDKLRASHAVARANLRRDLARAETQIVRAPFDGVLASRAVDPGDFVAAGATLARVVDDARFVRFAVPPTLLRDLQIGDAVRIALRGAAASWPGRVITVPAELDAAAGSGFARAALHSPPPTDLVCGTRVDVIVAAAGRPR